MEKCMLLNAFTLVVVLEHLIKAHEELHGIDKIKKMGTRINKVRW